MADRIISLVVTLDNLMNENDVQAVIDTIKMVKNVKEVEFNVFDGESNMNAWATTKNFKKELIATLISIIKKRTINE
jgi:hypothetical protein